MNLRYDQLSPVPPLTKVTKILIISCVAVYVVDFVLSLFHFQIGGLNLNEIFGLVPALIQEKKWAWQFVTYIFFHGHALHILLNMLILWYFGAEIEMRMGEKEFFKFFFLCGIGAGLFNFFVNVTFFDVDRLTRPIIGASGAIFGILAAYGIFFGNRYFLVFFLFPMKAKYFVLLIAFIELFTGVESGRGANVEDNVAHFAHLGGMAVGALYIYLFYIRPRGDRSRKQDGDREKLKRKFTLIVNPDEKEQGKGPSFWN